MAWTKAQLAEARRLHKRKGNKLSWSECIAKATKGTARKPAKKAVSGVRKSAKKAPAKKITVIRASAKKVNVKVGSLGSMALSKVSQAQKDEAALRKKLADCTNATEKKQIRAAITGIKKIKTTFKRFL